MKLALHVFPSDTHYACCLPIAGVITYSFLWSSGSLKVDSL